MSHSVVQPHCKQAASQIEEARCLLRDRGLVAHGLPVTRMANPHAGIAIGSAEVFSKLVALHVGASRDHGRIAVDSHHHVADVNGVIRSCPLLRAETVSCLVVTWPEA